MQSTVEFTSPFTSRETLGSGVAAALRNAILVKGKAGQCRPFQKVSSSAMPPGKNKLSGVEILIVRDWINAALEAVEPSNPRRRGAIP